MALLYTLSDYMELQSTNLIEKDHPIKEFAETENDELKQDKRMALYEL